MNNKVTHLDSDQIIKYSFDEDQRAQRVIVVGGANDSGISEFKNNADAVNAVYIPEIIRELSIKEVPVITKEIEIKEIPVPIIVKEIEVKEIQVPSIIKEIEIREIKVPEIIKEVEIRYIDKPIFKVPTYIQGLIAIQSIGIIGLLLINIIKH